MASHHFAQRSAQLTPPSSLWVDRSAISLDQTAASAAVAVSAQLAAVCGTLMSHSSMPTACTSITSLSNFTVSARRSWPH